VKLPNNTHVVANYVGAVQFTEQLILSDVLFILEFTLNIIFVEKSYKYFELSILILTKYLSDTGYDYLEDDWTS